MENRFFQVCDDLCRVAGKKSPYGKRRGGAPGAASYQASVWSHPFAAGDRVLVILIENGGVDLGIPALVDKLLSVLPGSSAITASMRAKLVDLIRKKIESFTDNLIETAELSINRYAKAKPDFFGDVIILRDGTSSYDDLKRTLLAQSRAGKIMDVIILTHGSGDFISVPGGVSGQKIKDIRTELGRPLTIRSVYMMNCVGSSLNQAWIDAGAKVSSGARKNNYLPEPSMFFFWSNWKDGQSFDTAVNSAYKKTINLMNDLVRGFLSAIPIVGSTLASKVDFATMDFVTDSAPVIQGQGSVTINSDSLSFTASATSGLVTTVVPLSLLHALSDEGAPAAGSPRAHGSVSTRGIEFIKRWEGFRATKYDDQAGHCTIGYGTLLHQGNCDGRESEKPYDGGITEEKATALLAQKVAQFQDVIATNVTVPLNQNQYDALISFVYNVGGGAFQKSTLLKVLNQSNYDAVPGEMKKWTKIRQNGQPVDSQGLVNRRNAEAALFAAPDTATAQSIVDMSRPFYDTGEHAILGEFINNAVSGPLAGVHALQPTTTFPINTVRFTYGQIITLGDFYETVDDALRAPAAELTRLQTLITRSENHYKNSILRIGSPAADVSNAEWGSPTTGIGPRYLDLALKNDSHFAPPASGTTSTLANNKQMWERYHTRAIAAARAGTSSAALDTAYPINAFGDHFLTDAFSAGHLVNKEFVMSKFIANVMSGSKVNSAGDKMFDKVANGALDRPAVKRKLGRYELTEAVLGKHFNLDTRGPLMPDIFYRVLKGIMEDTASGGQKQIANLAAKAVHDFLNTYSGGGVPVKNAKGNSWKLTGDGTLNLDNIKMIQLAVKQSVINIEDSVRNMATPVATFTRAVWDHVPLLTDPTTRSIVDGAITTFTDPNSSQLIAKAIDLIERELDTLIDALLRAGKIKLA